MSPYDDLSREIESYLGFLIDHELEESFAFEPINRTLSENKPAFQRRVASEEQKSVTPHPASAKVSALRPQNLGHLDMGTLLHEARQRSQAARTLDELYAELEAFEAMPMRHEGAKGLVRHRGNAKPDVLVIGEAPDIQEDAAGTAFQGKPGAMMDAALRAAGLGDVAMLACCAFWRPAGGRPMTDEDIGLTQPFLHALIRLTAPKGLLLLGAASVAAVLNLDQNLSKLRGRLISFGEGATPTPVMASYPPSFMIRQPASKGLFWNDLLCLAATINKV